jgi:peptidoglycan/LPS O-acetylase OafA/YrhL
VRGVAIAGVLLFHGGLRWARGGYLGVTVFFVLSGFLITSLLLAERDRTNGIDIKAVWIRRARRLAPARLVLDALVAAYEQFGATQHHGGVGGDAVAALGWVANWRFLFAHRSYAQLFAGPSPFQHTWSLSIEEQFYLLVALLAVVVIARQTVRAGRTALGVFGVLAVTYAALVPFGILGFTATASQLYYRTDIRMAEPLIGVLLAVVLMRKGALASLSTWPRRAVDAAGIVGAGVLVWAFHVLGEFNPHLFKGGLLVTSLGAAALVAASSQSGTVVGYVLSFPPLVALGKISYGVYLYHWPIALWLTHDRVPLDPVPLCLVRSGAAIAFATVSYFLIEQPIRQGKVRPSVALIGWVDGAVGVVALLLAATVVTPASTNLIAQDDRSGSFTTATTVAPPSVTVLAAGRATTSTIARTATTVAHKAPTKKPPPKGDDNGFGNFSGPVEPPAPPPAVTPIQEQSAVKVAVVGDSMAIGLAGGLKTWADEQNGGAIVYDLGASGCPMSRGPDYEEGQRRLPDGTDFPVHAECKWWDDPTSDRSVKLAEFDPDVIVVQDGVNELPDRKLEDWSTWRHTGQPSFDDWLLNEYTALIEALSKNGAKIVFLNTVCADWELMPSSFPAYAYDGEGDQRVHSLNRTDTALSLRGVQVADFNGRICPNGRFTQTVEGVDDGRPDGYHLSDDAAAALARRWLGPLVLQTAGSPAP